MPRPTSKDVRKLIIHHRQQGRSINDTANIVGVSSRTVLNIIKQYHERGTVSPCKSSGRPRLTTCQDDAYLIEKSEESPFKSAETLRSELGLSVSIDTVRRRLRKSNLPGRKAAKKQLLTPRNIMDRIGFAYQYQHWNDSDWASVIFMDEKSFSSDHSGDVWVHRPVGKRYESRYMQPQSSSGRFSLGVWGWMTSGGTGELIRINGNLTSMQYIDILNNSFLPSLEAIFGHEVVYIVHDKSPIHMARVTQNWLSEQTRLIVIDWPGRGADLNPIENVWAKLACNVRGQAETPNDLWQHIYQQSDNLRQTDICAKLIKTMPNRLKDVINNGGLWTKY